MLRFPRWWQLKYLFHPEIWGRWTHFDTYFSIGLVQPATSSRDSEFYQFHEESRINQESIRIDFGIGWWFTAYLKAALSLMAANHHFGIHLVQVGIWVFGYLFLNIKQANVPDRMVPTFGCFRWSAGVLANVKQQNCNSNYTTFFQLHISGQIIATSHEFTRPHPK